MTNDIESKVGTVVGSTLKSLIPWWVTLIVVIFALASVSFGVYLAAHAIHKYMVEHDTYLQQVHDLTTEVTTYKRTVTKLKACAAIEPVIVTRVQKVFADAAPALSANVIKHEVIIHDVQQAPESDDAVMAPVLQHTFSKLYAPTPQPVRP